MKWVVIGITWIVCGAISYGLVYHYYAERFKCFGWPNRWWHRTGAIVAAVSGPIGFIHRLMLAWDDTDNTKWQLRYRTVTPDESWNDYHQRWPTFSKERWSNHRL